MLLFFENKIFRFLSADSTRVAKEDESAYIVGEGEQLTPEKLLHTIGTNKSLNIVCANPQSTLESFCERLVVVKAAGGLVENSAGEILIIRRKGWPDLPKGHIDEGESSEQAAIREVQEETGLCDVDIVAPLCTTRHFHNAYGRWEVKQTDWYLMFAQGESPVLSPQQDEQITSAEWLRARRLWRAVEESYSTIKVVFEKFLEYKVNN